MSRKHIFNSGPCALPQQVYDEAIEAIKDFAGTGVSVLSVGHRSREWGDVMNQTRAMWRELLDIPQTHETVFFSGGASMGFLLVAMNFLQRKAAYLDTGLWSYKALTEARGIGEAYAIASSRDSGYNYIPKGFDVPSDLDYLHITSNNTIYGTQIKEDIDCPVPLIADMSSDILSRPVDVSRYAMIYGGAQKNAGAAGVAFAIVRKDALGKVTRHIPSMLDLSLLVEKESMFNTPPVFAIYVMNRTLNWIKSQGGVKALNERNREKARVLYEEIDRNSLFRGSACRDDRSVMNASFFMNEGYEGLEEKFLDFAKARDIVGIKGHRTVGGFRASIYNVCTLEDVNCLVEAMRDFENLNNN